MELPETSAIHSVLTERYPPRRGAFVGATDGTALQSSNCPVLFCGIFAKFNMAIVPEPSCYSDSSAMPELNVQPNRMSWPTILPKLMQCKVVWSYLKHSQNLSNSGPPKPSKDDDGKQFFGNSIMGVKHPHMLFSLQPIISNQRLSALSLSKVVFNCLVGVGAIVLTSKLLRCRFSPVARPLQMLWAHTRQHL